MQDTDDDDAGDSNRLIKEVMTLLLKNKKMFHLVTEQLKRTSVQTHTELQKVMSNIESYQLKVNSIQKTHRKLEKKLMDLNAEIIEI